MDLNEAREILRGVEHTPESWGAVCRAAEVVVKHLDEHADDFQRDAVRVPRAELVELRAMRDRARAAADGRGYAEHLSMSLLGPIGKAAALHILGEQ